MKAAVRYPEGLGGLTQGIKAVLGGLSRLLRDKELRKLAVMPVLITSVLYFAVLGVAIVTTADIVDWMIPQPDSGFWFYAWYLLVPLAFIFVLVLLGLLFMTIASAIAGPFYEKMALSILKRHDVEGHAAGFVEGLVGAVTRLGVFIVPSGICLLLGAIPYIGPIFFGVGTFIAWIGLAAEVNEPTLIATGHSLRERFGFLRHSFAAMIGMGGLVGISLLMPMAPLIFLPSGIVGAAELYAKNAAEEA